MRSSLLLPPLPLLAELAALDARVMQAAPSASAAVRADMRTCDRQPLVW